MHIISLEIPSMIPTAEAIKTFRHLYLKFLYKSTIMTKKVNEKYLSYM